MNPVYFKTKFKTDVKVEDLPHSFSIITGYATTGETWSDETNEPANNQLKQELVDLGLYKGEILGFDPETGHRELSFMAALGWEEGCELGLKYKQDAIYFVKADILYVTYCDERKKLYEVGSFRVRYEIQ